VKQKRWQRRTTPDRWIAAPPPPASVLLDVIVDGMKTHDDGPAVMQTTLTSARALISTPDGQT
jgi:hypothetical protein